MKFPSAYLLVSHGSRDPRPQIAAEHLASLILQRSSRLSALPPEPPLFTKTKPSASAQRFASRCAPLVGTVVLELAPLPLHQQIQHFAERASAAGYHHLQILPLFLLPGVHVMEDLPAEVETAQRALGTAMTLELRPYLGSHPRLRQLLLNPFSPVGQSANSGRVLLAHGSRRPEGHELVEAIAAELNALPAYWSMAPSLESQVTELNKQGCQHIAVLPYFLFDGGITDAIGQEVHRLAQQFPALHLHLARPLGATPPLADLVVELMT